MMFLRKKSSPSVQIHSGARRDEKKRSFVSYVTNKEIK